LEESPTDLGGYGSGCRVSGGSHGGDGEILRSAEKPTCCNNSRSVTESNTTPYPSNASTYGSQHSPANANGAISFVYSTDTATPFSCQYSIDSFTAQLPLRESTLDGFFPRKSTPDYNYRC
jgi:hypothetical protein